MKPRWSPHHGIAVPPQPELWAIKAFNESRQAMQAHAEATEAARALDVGRAARRE